MQIKQNRRQNTEPRYKLSKQWEEKALKYPKRAKEADVGRNKTNQWLRSTGLKKNLEKKNSKDAAVSFLVITPFAVHLRKIYNHLRQQLRL